MNEVNKYLLPDIRLAVKIMVFSFFYIYVLQYPLSFIVNESPYIPESYTILLYSTFFILYSILISITVFIYSDYKYVLNKKIIVIKEKSLPLKKSYLLFYIFLIIIFFIWSYLMLTLRVGITIYYDTQPLPFRLVGILFYGRLFLQPIILSLIAYKLRNERNIIKIFFFLLLLILLIFNSLVSGSRFIAIIYSIPIALIFFKNNQINISVALSASILGIIVSSVSRVSFLLIYLNDDLLNIVYQDDDLKIGVEYFLSIIYNYLIIRPMGLAENMQTLNYFQPSQSLLESFNYLLSYFIPFIFTSEQPDFKAILGYGDDTYGGIGLDLFSNYWIYFGSNYLTYTFGLIITMYLLRKSYQNIALVMSVYNLENLSIVIFFILFLFIFDARANILLYAFFASFFLKIMLFNKGING